MPIRLSTPAAVLTTLAGSAHALAAGSFPASLDLSSLDGTNGFVINGIRASDRSGFSVASAGDVNGDGVDDLIIGAPEAGLPPISESYVVFGGPAVGAGGSLDLSSLNGANGFAINGIDLFDNSGFSVSSAGDVNGDGVDDVIIGDPYPGESYVVFGAPGVGAGGTLELSSLDGASGFVLNGIQSGSRLGWSVSSAGDVNADGVDDLIIGARGASPGPPSVREASGQTFVVFGDAGLGVGGVIDLSALDGADGFVLNGIDEYDASGWSVSSAGDVNGDGVDDVLIGAPFGDPGGQSYAGESYVVFGGPGVGAGGSLELSSLNGTGGFVINGIDADDYSGVSVSSAGDVNGDGVDDVIVGAPGGDPNGQSYAGESYVVFGGPGIGAAGSLDLSSVNGVNGFVINGIDAEDRSGFSVSSAGDVNGDGVDDVIIGAPVADAVVGESYVVFGGAGVGAGGSVELSALNGTDGFVLNAVGRLAESGRSVASAGDVNGDGVDDVIIGAPYASGRPGIRAGYVVFGRAPAPVCPGDVNGDGATDIFDFADLADSFGAGPGATRAQGDLNGDGFVDVFDFGDLADDFGCGT